VGDTATTMQPLTSLQRVRLLPAVALVALAAVVGGAAGPAVADGASGYTQNLYRPGDFVRQTNLVQCVGTSMQMMINIVAAAGDRSASTQLRLQNVARAYSDLLSPRPGRQGASVWGWAAGLNELGYGPYEVVGFPTIDDAMHAAAQAIRFTGRPVGLLMWRGRHAWVMTGFRATLDPRTTQGFRVTDAYVLDPLYPATNPTWGRSPAPGTRLSIAELGRDFVARRVSNGTGNARNLSLGGRFVLVLPMGPMPSSLAGTLNPR
jgi:hypothetical protein